MMYLIFSMLFSASASTQTPFILKLDQYSGYTPPQFAMEAHCTLELTQRIVSKILRERKEDGWNIEINSEKEISDAELQQVQTWINEAAEGPFKQGANPCDIGTVKIVTSTYPLIVSKDCGKKTENLHPSAINLISWFRTACGLEGKKR